MPQFIQQPRVLNGDDGLCSEILHQRTADLTESLEQQTATSEVLKIISGSQGELQPVFEAMLENATRICEANFRVLNLHENGAFAPRRDAQCAARLR